ncbi:secondary active sulfate transmembrane transporter [Fragilaria crotonensis]|nr:secondary active sulfate transmembrane transporter [Fragilaria crotonensis]
MDDIHDSDADSYNRPSYFRTAAVTLKYGDCSPMVTHLHLTPPHDMSPPSRARNQSRSKSLGSEADLLLPSIAPVFQSIPSGLSPVRSSQLLQVADEDEKPEEVIPLFISALYGLINAFIVLPVLMSFGSIIYRDEAFAPYMPVLVKLTVVSGMVHQLCFSTFSGLPFAVGQVQDAGLIFLSSMAGSLVEYCRSRNQDDEVMLATVTVGLSLATALLGLGLVIIGNLRLAQYVQLLPTPVIGGYLAYIGFFCGFSGLALMANGGGSTLSMPILLEHFMLVLPGLAGGIMIYVLVRHLRHMLVLPLCIVFLLSAFYLGLILTDTTVADATGIGWIRPSKPPPAWYDTWDYLKLDKVLWDAFPSQILTLLSMIFVVALSSSLDVAAIELELNEPLNYNSELTMVGLSNLMSGLTGGYTGSYIFSQTIFSLRAGITSRTAGFVLAGCELIILILPIPILSYLPNFFFGSLLIMISVDLMCEWLWEVQFKLTNAEYFVCLATFGLIQFAGVEYGIILGVLLYLLFGKLGLHVGIKATDDNSGEVVQPSVSKSVHSPNAYGATTNYD